VERLLGFTPEEVTDAPEFWGDHIHPDDLARTGAAVTELTSGALTQVECEQRLLGKDGWPLPLVLHPHAPGARRGGGVPRHPADL
jgi:hypothetical protein